ncbi:MAG: protease pro-enzyme activation domain-containing protein [Terracidiphilus sp.]
MRLLHPLVAAVVVSLAGSAILPAQKTADRIREEVNASSTVTLPGTVNPRAASEFDRGRLNAGTRIHGMTLHFQPTAEQKAALDALVLAQQTPGSGSYHEWLTPQQYASRFGLSDNDLQKVETWLEQQGLAIDRVSNSRTSLVFSGDAGQVEAAFGTEMHRYVTGGKTHFANATAIQVPAALEGIVRSVRNLDDFRPAPMARFRSPSTTKVTANFTSSQSSSHFLTPKDVATIYDINAAYNSAYTGTGQSIAIVGQSEISVSDIEKFQSAAGLTVKDPTLVLVPDSGSAAVSSGDEAESDLDLEYSGAIAKGATIYLVYVGNNSNYSVWDSLQYAVDTRIAPVISMSYGACESELSSSDYASLEAIMEEGASQGQSIVVSSGDSGSTGCYDPSEYNDTVTAAQEVLAVDYPASSAYAVALGGTEFPSADVEASNTTYWESASGSDVISSALSYIPEQVWNDDSASVGAADGAEYAISSGGGGTSTLTARPSWQTGVTGIPSGSYRLVPDVSLDSSPDNAGYLYCSSDTSATDITGSCSNGFRDSSDEYLTVAGGTSFAAPIFAGMLAIINQKVNSDGLGVANSTLYSLAANSTTYASAFHDITSGGNECAAGSSYCSSAGESEYYATTGYDEASGLGSVDFYNLLSAWPETSSSSLDASITTLSAASSDPSSGASDGITIKVAAESSSVTSTPTGTLTIAVDGATVTSSLALSGGSATYTFSSSTSGSHVIVATYSGSSIFAASTGTVTLTVGSSSSSGSGGSGSTSVTVTPSGGYTGTVDFSLTTSNTYLEEYACYSISDAAVSSTTAVSETLTLYTGTANCSSASLKSTRVRSFRSAGTGEVSSGAAHLAREASVGCLGFLLAGLLGWRVRRLRAFLSILMLGAVAFAFSGCGGSSSTSTSSGSSSKSFSLSVSPSTVTVSAGSSGIPTGSYSITIEGVDSSSSSLSATTDVTLTVD